MSETKTQKYEAPSKRMRDAIQRRYTTEESSLVVADVVAIEYEPRVAALEEQLVDLLKKLGETGESAKKGK